MTRSTHITRRELITRLLPAATAMAALGRARASAGASFDYGVASGDPTQDSVIIWTRVTPRFRDVTEVRWELATDPACEYVVASGVAYAGEDRDFTVKVDVTGLEAGTRYYYRFSALSAVSDIGRTRTLPAGPVERFGIAACSCSNFPAGYFNAYAALARDDHVDVVLHLGDYIYEYGRGGYATEDAAALHRRPLPGHEIVSLADYRARYAQYRADPDLQAAHARHPFIAVWDDHESANDAWRGGAQNHDPSERAWALRKHVALQAYFEWMPIREPLGRPTDAIWRRFEIGDLATLVMLETRLHARDQQIDLRSELPMRRVPFDVSDPTRPRPILDPAQRAGLRDDQVEEVVVPFDLRGERPEPVLDYAAAKAATPETLEPGFAFLPDVARFREEVLAPNARRLISDRQREFVAGALAESRAAGKPWQVLGNQTLLSPVTAPNVVAVLTPEQRAALPDYLRAYIDLTAFAPPLSIDAWDGYAAERRWLLEQIGTTGANAVVLTGDSHAAWAFDVPYGDGDRTAAVEFGATSISSPGFTEALGLDGAQVEALLLEANPHLRFSEVSHRGYLRTELEPERLTATFVTVSTVASRRYETAEAARFVVEPGPSGPRLERVAARR